MASGLLFNVDNPYSKASNTMAQAGNTFGSMAKKNPNTQRDEPTIGGAAMSGLGAASTAASVGTVAMAGPTSAAGTATAGLMGLGLGPLAGIGAAVGIGAYLLS